MTHILSSLPKSYNPLIMAWNFLPKAQQSLETLKLTPKRTKGVFAQNCLQIAPFESKLNSAKLDQFWYFQP
jgi:hypothetical protein